MAAPYRANHQYKVKAHTSEASKRYRAKPCRSLRQSLNRRKPTSGAEKSEKAYKSKEQNKAVSEQKLCTALFLSHSAM